MEVRRAKPADLAAIMELERASFSIPWSEMGMEAELCSADVIFNTAWEGGKLAGFAVLHRSFDEAELYNIVVEEHCRGKGIGITLLRKTLQDAVGFGVRRIYLEVRKSNNVARSLYVQCGFAVCGERRGYYDAPREDALLMDWHCKEF